MRTISKSSYENHLKLRKRYLNEDSDLHERCNNILKSYAHQTNLGNCMFQLMMKLKKESVTIPFLRCIKMPNEFESYELTFPAHLLWESNLDEEILNSITRGKMVLVEDQPSEVSN